MRTAKIGPDLRLAVVLRSLTSIANKGPKLNECNIRLCGLCFLKEKTVFGLVQGSNVNASVIKDNRCSRNQCKLKHSERYTSLFYYPRSILLDIFLPWVWVSLRKSSLFRLTPLPLASPFACSLHVTFHDNPQIDGDEALSSGIEDSLQQYV